MAGPLVRGLVDIHCHGGGGHTFGDSVESSVGAAAVHYAHGTDFVVGSLVTAPVATLARQLAVMREAMAVDGRIVGAHLEGPFLAPERKGAHDPAHLAHPTASMVDDLLAAGEGVVRQITIAPELPGALDAIARFAAAGVIAAVGHTTASATLAREAFDAGARLLTHAFNAMPGVVGRDPGPVGVALADPRVSIEVIADGMHVDPVLIALLFSEAPGRVVLVTDAMAAAGAGDGFYELGGLDVEVRGGRAVIAGTETLAGSTLTLERAVSVAMAGGVSQADAVAAASSVPAALLGLSV
jgi:N-acetylglucosamine-6-phosphate deacetylase